MGFCTCICSKSIQKSALPLPFIYKNSHECNQMFCNSQYPTECTSKGGRILASFSKSVDGDKKIHDVRAGECTCSCPEDEQNNSSSTSFSSFSNRCTKSICKERFGKTVPICSSTRSLMVTFVEQSRPISAISQNKQIGYIGLAISASLSFILTAIVGVIFLFLLFYIIFFKRKNNKRTNQTTAVISSPKKTNKTATFLPAPNQYYGVTTHNSFFALLKKTNQTSLFLPSPNQHYAAKTQSSFYSSQR